MAVVKLIRFLIAAVLAFSPAWAGPPPAGARVLFLGDSITYNGAYIHIIEAALIASSPDEPRELLNLGLSSETVSALSEEGHAGGQFPRPDLHERLHRVLTAVKPSLVVACYGMNDGIYHPFDEERALAYQNGIRRLREAILAAGADVIHLTPPVFDSQPISEKVLPAGQDAYPAPFSGYNDVLGRYAEWLMETGKNEGWQVLDLHQAMRAALASRRESDPQFTFSRDGIHPDAAGHLVMARPLLESWGLKVTAEGHPDHPQGAAILDLTRRKQQILRDAWLTRTGHLRPGVKEGLPMEEAREKADELDREARALARAGGG